MFKYTYIIVRRHARRILVVLARGISITHFGFVRVRRTVLNWTSFVEISSVNEG